MGNSQLQEKITELLVKGGASETELSWTDQERFHPGEGDILMAFPKIDEQFFAEYLEGVIGTASVWAGLKLLEWSFSGSTGLVKLSDIRSKQATTLIINCAQKEQGNGLNLLLRIC